jgi:hypothetical protein
MCLSNMMKFCPSLLHLTWHTNHSFVQRVHAVCITCLIVTALSYQINCCGIAVLDLGSGTLILSGTHKRGGLGAYSQ